MHFVLTNDDGFRAEGLAALYAAIRPLGRITVVAPRAQHSIKGHAVTMDRPLTVERVEVPGMGNIYTCDGTPADCVRLAVTQLNDGAPVDWVLAGINHGANLGVDMYYSGTVAAAREGAILGCKAVACSQYFAPGMKADWDASSERIGTVLRELFEHGAFGPTLWSVTLPVVSANQPRVHVAPQGLEPLSMEYECTSSADGSRTVYEYRGEYQKRPARPGSDVAVVFGGDIVVTPLLLDATDRTQLGSSTDRLGRR